MPARAMTTEIPYGDPGIEETVRRIRSAAYEGTGDPGMIEWTHDAVRSVPARDTDGEASAIFAKVKRSFRYTHDPTSRELVKTPHVIAKEIREKGVAVGDCDDYVTFLLCALQLVGIRAEPLVVSQDTGTYSHILVRYLSPQRGWTTLDAITKNGVGWFPPNMARAAVLRNGSLAPIPPKALSTPTRFGGSASVVSAPTTAAPVRGHARALVPAAASPYPALAGCSCEGTSKPNNPAAKASAALAPYTDLMWWVWAAVSVGVATKVIRSRR